MGEKITIVQLKAELEAERMRSHRLEKQLAEVSLASSEKSREQQAVLQAIEIEEERLTNSLQKKLRDLRQDVGSLENKMEAEQEFLVHQMQKKLMDAEREIRTLKEDCM